jgi:CheY-like chemotaxis protein
MMTAEEPRPSIFWFEDYPRTITDYIAVLKDKYTVEVGADKTSIERQRISPIDLAIVDIMIETTGTNLDGQKVTNINVEEVSADYTGIEFLRAIREGHYVQYGFAQNVPVIMATAVIETPVKQEAEKLGVLSWLEKVFTIDSLLSAIDKALEVPQRDEEPS